MEITVLVNSVEFVSNNLHRHNSYQTICIHTSCACISTPVGSTTLSMCESISERISHNTPSLLGFALRNFVVHSAIHSRICKLGPIIHKVSIFHRSTCSSTHSLDTFSHSHKSRRHVQAFIVIGRHHHSNRHSTIPSAILDPSWKLLMGSFCSAPSVGTKSPYAQHHSVGIEFLTLLNTISRHQVSDFCLAPSVGTKSSSLLSTIFFRHQVSDFSSTPIYPGELCSCDEL